MLPAAAPAQAAVTAVLMAKGLSAGLTAPFLPSAQHPNQNLNQEYVQRTAVLSARTYPAYIPLVILASSNHQNAQAAVSLAASMVSVLFPTAAREVEGAGAGLEC